MKSVFHLEIAAALIFAAACVASVSADARGKETATFTVRDGKLLVAGAPFKVRGLRLANALISEEAADRLIGQGLDLYRSYGVNMISVYLMGSRFGDIKGYRPDGSLDPIYARRLGRIIEAAEARDMIVLVGCLYWGGSKASEELKGWKQADADRAIFNTVKWLTENHYTNVFVDPDNEGMAHDEMRFDHARMIDAGHAANPAMMMAYNYVNFPPDNADILIHFSPAFHPKSPRPRPYLESEGTPPPYMVGEYYWGMHSRGGRAYKRYNYENIGVYTPEMRAAQKLRTGWGLKYEAGYVLASTWLQAPDAKLADPGGQGTTADPGIRWWLEYVRAHPDGEGVIPEEGPDRTRRDRPDMDNHKTINSRNQQGAVP